MLVRILFQSLLVWGLLPIPGFLTLRAMCPFENQLSLSSPMAFTGQPASASRTSTSSSAEPGC